MYYRVINEIPTILLIAIIIIAVFISFIGFEKAFLIFHEISFTNDLWKLDPRKDYLVAIFPQGFFYETTILIGFLTLIEAIFILALTRLLKEKLWG